jgi:hypothetical protein
MFNNRATWRVEVTFVATPPARQLERASGVSDVDVDDHTIRCLVCGSFQPFIEALRGHEVICLSSIPALDPIHRGGGTVSPQPKGNERDIPNDRTRAHCHES